MPFTPCFYPIFSFTIFCIAPQLKLCLKKLLALPFSLFHPNSQIFHVLFVDDAWCCSRLARFVQQCCSWACALVRFSTPNMLHYIATGWSNMHRHCCNMFRWNVAIICLGGACKILGQCCNMLCYNVLTLSLHYKSLQIFCTDSLVTSYYFSCFSWKEKSIKNHKESWEEYISPEPL